MKLSHRCFVTSCICLFIGPLLWAVGDWMSTQAGVGRLALCVEIWAWAIGVATIPFLVATLWNLDNRK